MRRHPLPSGRVPEGVTGRGESRGSLAPPAPVRPGAGLSEGPRGGVGSGSRRRPDGAHVPARGRRGRRVFTKKPAGFYKLNRWCPGGAARAAAPPSPAGLSGTGSPAPRTTRRGAAAPAAPLFTGRRCSASRRALSPVLGDGAGAYAAPPPSARSTAALPRPFPGPRSQAEPPRGPSQRRAPGGWEGAPPSPPPPSARGRATLWGGQRFPPWGRCAVRG